MKLRSSRRWLVSLSFLFLLTSLSAHALDNGLARTPPMGWNSWNKFACDGLNEKVVRATADTMAANGMKDAGYHYVILDDCWQVAVSASNTGRDPQGNILVDTAKFPSGIKALADYIHSKGLKFGIYTDVGTMTCAKRSGSIGHEYQDARQYAAWGVDYLKEDWCNTLPGQSAESSYTLMRDALAAATADTAAANGAPARPILFSLCEWGSNHPWLWAGPVGNMWRSTPDIQDCWDCKKTWGGNGVTEILDQLAPLYSYAGPGHWNDPDMLEVGNGGMTTEEYRTHFSMWALLAAPLLAGNDIANMTPDTREILLNKDVIVVDQDTLGIQGHRVRKEQDLEVWSKQLADGGRAVVLLNRGSAPAQITARWTDIGYPDTLKAEIRNLWTHQDLGPPPPATPPTSPATAQSCSASNPNRHHPYRLPHPRYTGCPILAAFSAAGWGTRLREQTTALLSRPNSGCPNHILATKQRSRHLGRSDGLPHRPSRSGETPVFAFRFTSRTHPWTLDPGPLMATPSPPNPHISNQIELT